MTTSQLHLDLTPAQARGFVALTRNISPMEIERIALEAGEAECILSALDELTRGLNYLEAKRRELSHVDIA